VGHGVRLLAGLALVAGGVLVGLYGLFALLYNGDCSHDCGDVYVTFRGRQMNANLVGWIALALALGCVSSAVWILRRRGSRAAGSD
jgi:hypothetical protein